MEEREHLLIPTSSSSSPTPTTTILTRLTTILIISSLSLWANHQASKGFHVTILNPDPTSPAGRRFHLMFVSNGRAERAVIEAADSVDRALFPNELYPRKPIDRITVRMADSDLTDSVSVTPSDNPDRGAEVIINLGPSLVAGADASSAVAAAVRRGVAHARLWDGRGAAPRALLDAMAEYLAAAAAGIAPVARNIVESTDGPCWAERESLAVLGFLEYGEDRRPGFVARLNRAMSERWSAGAVDVALGAPAQRTCAEYRLSARRPVWRAGSTTEVEVRQVM